MRIHPIPILDDNYAYLIVDETSKQSAIVDPSEPEKVIEFLKTQPDAKVTHLLTTHHHWDHSQGNEAMKKHFPDLTVVGSKEDAERIPALTHAMKHKDTIELGSLKIQAFFTPCHTRNHLLYYVTDKSGDPPAIFTGDTLFVAGCGRFFEGNAEEMHYALNKVVAKLPQETLIYCGHEYTVKNLMFAMSVEPETNEIQDKYEWAKKQRKDGKFTIPSTVASELQTNPFMRVSNDAVQLAMGTQGDEVATMAALRAKKDKF